MELLQFLTTKGKIKKEQVEKIKKEMEDLGVSLEEAILKLKVLHEQELFELKSQATGIPLKKEIPEEVSSEILRIIPPESAEYYKMIPLGLDRKNRVLDVGMVYPENPVAEEALKFLTRQQNLKPRIFLISLSAFRKLFEKYRAPKKEVEKALESLEKELKSERGEKLKRVEFEKLIEEAPIIKMVAVILRQAVEGRASDIHIEPTKSEVRVRYRLDGILYTSIILPRKVLPAIVARIKILSNLKIDETRIPQDGRFSSKINDKTIDFRVSTFPTALGEKVAIRILNPEEGLKPLSELGLQGRNLKVLKEGIKNPYGMILVTGPTGSGKTTTLYSVLNILNKEGVNIVTLEDPVEYFIDKINQSQIRPDIGYTFATGLRQILRQDPDIIMVGEIRDEETASLAIHAALTGHLVLSTLHTTNVIGVIPRLIDMNVRPFLIAPTLSLALNQRLVRVLCKHCKKRVKAQGESKKFILNTLKNMPASLRPKIKEPIYIYEPQGCKKCNFKGYLGRTGIFEILKMTDNLSKLIVKNPQEGEILKEARNQGMATLLEDGLLKVLEGVTSIEEIMRVAEEE